MEDKVSKNKKRTKTELYAHYCIMEDNIDKIKIDLSEVKKDVSEAKEDISFIKKKLKDINAALLGDEYREDGLIKDVREHDEYIAKDKLAKARIYGAAAVISVLVSGAMILLQIWFSK